MDNLIRSFWEYLTNPHPAITEQTERWQARLTATIILVIFVGVSLNLLIGASLHFSLLFPLILAYLFSRTRHFRVASYIILGTLLGSTIVSILEDADYGKYVVFTNIAWLSLSLLLTSLLFSVKEMIFVSAVHILAIVSLVWLIPEMDMRSVGVGLGFFWIFSALLIATMAQRNWLENMRQQEIRLQATALESSDYAVMIINQRREIIWVNPAYEKLTGYTLQNIYTSELPFINHPHPNERLAAQIWDTLSRGQTWEGVVTNYKQSGEAYDESMIITPVLSEKGEISHYVTIKHDITEQIAGEERLKFLATHDILTSLPNRGLLHDRLEQAIARSRRNQTVGAVLYLDLDNFKQINDAYSHEDGDHVLMILAQRMKALTRETDTLARISGDEFVLLMEDVKDKRNISLLTERILYEIAKPIHLQLSQATVTASIGIALFPQDGENISELLQNADVAMYYSKSKGKNSYVFFSRNMKEDAIKKVSLGRDLRSALVNLEFFLEYQPLVNLRTNRIIGAEALIRWRHPTMGIIYPNDFIPLIEDNNLIMPISEWVVQTAVAFFQEKTSPLLNNLQISINLSGQQLGNDHHYLLIADLIKTSGINPQLVQLEITETTIFEHMESTISELKRLRSLGVKLAIDDFGTGYSSLSYIEQFPIEVIKIDSSFIRRIVDRKTELPILNGIISIAHQMDLKVIAEGVETKDQLDYLRTHGCNLVQGFYLYRPMRKDELIKTIEAQ
ncbi:MAG: putative bifunctional diguanylate cyclase/phosphodiesterase [Anaerolineales bacterium]